MDTIGVVCNFLANQKLTILGITLYECIGYRVISRSSDHKKIYHTIVLIEIYVTYLIQNGKMIRGWYKEMLIYTWMIQIVSDGTN